MKIYLIIDPDTQLYFPQHKGLWVNLNDERTFRPPKIFMNKRLAEIAVKHLEANKWNNSPSVKNFEIVTMKMMGPI